MVFSILMWMIIVRLFFINVEEIEYTNKKGTKSFHTKYKFDDDMTMTVAWLSLLVCVGSSVLMVIH